MEASIRVRATDTGLADRDARHGSRCNQAPACGVSRQRCLTYRGLARRTALAVSAVLASACATVPQLPDSHPLQEAYAHVQLVRHARIQALDKTNEPPPKYVSRARPIFKHGESYRELTLSISPDTPTRQRVLGVEDWNAGFKQACAHLDGVFESPFCVSRQDPDAVLFMATIQFRYHPNWLNSTSLEVTFVEPPQQPGGPEFQRLAQAAGFVPKSTQITRARAAEAAAADRAAAERARLAVDWPRMQVRGQMVCSDERGVRYIGYVEDFTDERMKVSVAQAQIGRTGYSPGGFRPNVIWTRPEGWFPCEGAGSR